MTQLILPALKIQLQKEVNGIEMGVFSDGSTFFSQKSLAKLCGVANSSISDVSNEWAAGKKTSKLARWLEKQGFSSDSLYRKIERAGTVVYAYPEEVSTLVLDYYAFEVTNATALSNYRTLGRAGLRAFVYTALGYAPAAAVPLPWRQFHDRMLLASAPPGFFSVFKEIADFVIAAINAGLPVDEQIVPDISVGITWAEHWKSKGLASKHGERVRHDHNYPDYFPQAASNPQEIWVYPVEALGEFRVWLHKVYVPTKFPEYVKKKIAKGVLPPSAAQIVGLPPQKAKKLLPKGS